MRAEFLDVRGVLDVRLAGVHCIQILCVAGIF